MIIDDDDASILGYFSLSFKEVILDNCPLSKGAIKKIDGRNKNATKARAFLIGQIAKNFMNNSNSIDLAYILEESTELISKAREIVGGRIVIIECENNNSLIKLYEKHDFQTLKVDESPDGLVTMFLFIE